MWSLFVSGRILLATRLLATCFTRDVFHPCRVSPATCLRQIGPGRAPQCRRGLIKRKSRPKTGRVDSPHSAEATFAANAAAVVRCGAMRCGAMRCGQTPAAANPTFAKQAGVPLTRIEGRSACFASQNRRAKHRLMPLGPVGWGRKCFANVGLAIPTLTASSVHQAVQAIGTHCPAQKRPTSWAGLKLFIYLQSFIKGEIAFRLAGRIAISVLSLHASGQSLQKFAAIVMAVFPDHHTEETIQFCILAL